MPDIYISTLELSGIDPETKAASNVRVDFSPYQAWVVDTDEGDAWLTRNILRVRLPDGEKTVSLLATPTGNAYEVQERGFRGARHGYKVISDSDTNYADIPWVDKDTLDPETPLSPAWVAEAEALAADITTAQDAADGAQSTADAAQSDATAALSGLSTKVNTSTYTAGLALKADATALTSEIANRTAALALKADVTALTAEADTRADDDQTIAQALSDYSTAANAAIALKVTAPTSPADGQLIAWSTSLGAWTKVNPVGAGRIAAAINTTNTVTALSAAVGVGGGVGTQVVIPSTAISVTNSGGRPVVIHFGATFLQNVAGVGSVYLALTETTSGNVDKVSHVTNLSNSTAPVLASLTLGAYEFDIGAVTTTRTFTLRALLYTSSASCGGNILNSAANPSWIRAVAE